jgi:hypothetical protein
VTGNGRWQLVLLDALAESELVGVVAAVDRHLGRRATRVELTAARRTAARLARDGRLPLHQVRVAPGQQARGGLFVVVARPGATVDEGRLQQAPLRPHQRPNEPAAVEEERRTTARHANQVVVGVEHAAVDARRVDVDHLPAEAAARLAEQLIVALAEVTGLQRRLRRRAQHAAVSRKHVSSDE